jgi:riboflavin kinase/FMN adenylyltransferase
VKIYQCIRDFEAVAHPIVTIGTFDGVHLGHQAIFSKMKEEAGRTGGETIVITFFPHPRLVLYQDSVNLKFINTREKKIERLEKIGIDHLIIIPFTKEFARNSSEQFVTDYVVKYVHPAKVIIGYDHHFGKNREGNFQLLERLKQKLGYEVEEVPPFYVDGAPVSSTRIRDLLHDGNVKEANRMLGYEYAITGKVVRGQRIGHKIGFPTANLEIPNEYKLITANGVYVCRVLLGNRILKGMGNIGVRPTIDHGDLTIEVHIFDFDEDIYDEKITIQFVDRLRDEKKFENLEALKAQLAKDKVLSIERL